MTHPFDNQPGTIAIGYSNKPDLGPQRAETPSVKEDAKDTLPTNEADLLDELIGSIRAIRYGSIVLTIHEGQLVEISKTTRFRRSATARKK